MSISGSQGYIGVAVQGFGNSIMDTPPDEGSYKYVEAIASPFQPQDQARTRRPTIGDNPLPRNAYKVGTHVAGAIGLELTPDITGRLLYLALGQAGTPSAFGTAYKHSITFKTGDHYAIPYFGVKRGVGQQILDMAYGAKMNQFALNFTAGDAAQATFQFLGRKFQGETSYPAASAAVQTIVFDANTASGTFVLGTELGDTAAITWDATPATLSSNIESALNAVYGAGAVTVGEAGGTYTVTWTANGYHPLMTVSNNSLLDAGSNAVADPTIAMTNSGGSGITYDNTPMLTVVSDTADILLETSSGTYEGAADGIISLGVVMQFNNMLTAPTRYRIGSPYPIDFTLLDRAATIQLSMEIDDPTLFRKVYYNGGTVWDPTPWVGGLKLKATSAEKPFTDPSSNPIPYSLEVLLSSLQFQALLIANEPQRVVNATLTANLLKNTSGGEPVQIDIITGRSKAFSDFAS